MVGCLVGGLFLSVGWLVGSVVGCLLQLASWLALFDCLVDQISWLSWLVDFDWLVDLSAG